MKRMNLLVFSCLFSICLSTTVLGGDMPGPGAPIKSSKPKPHAMSAICEPIDPASEASATSACQEATTDLATDAIILAALAVASVY